MKDQELRIVVNAKDNASGVLKKVKGELDSSTGAMSSGLDRAASSAKAATAAIARFAARAGLMAGAAGAAGVTVGFKFNNALEQAQTKLMAFTGDAGQVAKTLAWVKDEAAKTQFSFTDMANAAASLTPVSRMSGRSLEELIRQAEVLAAINPAEGLTGAVFSLREALTGDWVSIVDRFNLPRKRINELKAQGVPAMEIITRTLGEMGITYDLVSKQGQTTAARFDQIKDKFQILAGELTKPIFDLVSRQLFALSERLDVLVPQFKATVFEVSANLIPRLQHLAQVVGDYLSPKLQALWNTVEMQLLPVLGRLWREVLVPLLPVIGTGLVMAVGAAVDALNLLIMVVAPLIQLMLNHKEIVLGVVAAYVALKAALAISGAIAAVQGAMVALNSGMVASTISTIGLRSVLMSMALPGGAFALVAAAAIAAGIAIKQSMLDAADAVNNAKLSMADLDRSADDSVRKMQRAAAEARAAGDTAKAAQIARQINAIAGQRDTGGPVSAGQAYVVGERQAEVFVPNTSGRILPSADDAPGGTGEVTNILSGNFYFYTAEAVDAFFTDRLDKTQRLARVGMG